MHINKEIIKRLEDDDPTLTELCLFNKKIGDDGATALASALETNKTLESLHLMGNQIGDDGATALATALTRNNKTLLTILNLMDNKISPSLATLEGREIVASAQALKRLTLLMD